MIYPMPFVSLFFSAIGVVTSQDVWNWNSLPNANARNRNLACVRFADPQVGYIVGDSGFILKTTNGGSTWAIQNSGTIKNLKSIFLLNSDTIFVAGLGGTILKTVDGGNTWNSYNTNTAYNLRSVFFTSADTGYAVGDTGTIALSGIILKTTDGGMSWIGGPIINTLRAPRLYSVYFLNSRTGFIAGEIGYRFGAVWKTVDAGVNWSLKVVDTAVSLYFPAGRTSGWLNSISFRNDTTGYAVGAAYGSSLAPSLWTVACLRTDDGGDTWTREGELENLTPTDGPLYEIFMFPNSGGFPGRAIIGYAVGDDGIYWSYIQGQSWSWDGAYDMRSIHFPDTANGYAVGLSGRIYKKGILVSIAPAFRTNRSKPALGSHGVVIFHHGNRIENRYFDPRGRILAPLFIPGVNPP